MLRRPSTIRVREDNSSTNSLKDVRPTKKPRTNTSSVITSKPHSSTQAFSRTALADVSNKNDIFAGLAVKRGVSGRGGLAAAKRKSGLSKSSTLNTQQDKVSKSQNQMAINAAGRVVLRSKRKAASAFKEQDPVVEPFANSVETSHSFLPAESSRNTSLSELLAPMEGLSAHDTTNTSAMCIAAESPASLVGQKENQSGHEIHVNPIDHDIKGENELNDEEDELNDEENEEEQNEIQKNINSEEEEEEEEEEENDVLFDIDSIDAHDPLQVVEYAEEIFEYLREKELSTALPRLGYMKAQGEINHKMRGVLVDWMIDVSTQFNLLSETVFLSVQLLDRLLMRKEVSRTKMQLVGVAAMVIACKFEETRTPYIDDFVWVAADAFPRTDVIKMEKIMLGVMNYDMSLPTPLHFLRRFSKAAQSDSQTHTLSKYLIEYTLPAYSMLAYSPSLIAAAAVYLARKMTNKSPTWTKTLEHYTQYSELRVESVASELNSLRANPNKQKQFAAVNNKYRAPPLFSVSKMPAISF